MAAASCATVRSLAGQVITPHPVLSTSPPKYLGERNDASVRMRSRDEKKDDTLLAHSLVKDERGIHATVSGLLLVEDERAHDGWTAGAKPHSQRPCAA